MPGAGNLLGNLLCGITNLLNPAGLPPLSQLTQILNALLALAPRTASPHGPPRRVRACGSRRARGGEIAPPPGGASATPARRSRSRLLFCEPCTPAFTSATASARSRSTRRSARSGRGGPGDVLGPADDAQAPARSPRDPRAGPRRRPGRPRRRLGRLVVQVDSIRELDAKGIEIEPPTSPDGTEDFLTAWLTDPDGRRIELVQWPPGHPEGMTAATSVSAVGRGHEPADAQVDGGQGVGADRLAVDALEVRPADRLLEIGSAAAWRSPACERLTTGDDPAIDRSAKMIALATRRNREHVDAARRCSRPSRYEEARPGRWALRQGLRLQRGPLLAAAGGGARGVRARLAPDGAVHVFWDARHSAPDRAQELGNELASGSARAGSPSTGCWSWTCARSPRSA